MTPHDRLRRREELMGEMKYARDALAAAERDVTETAIAAQAAIAKRDRACDTLGALEAECERLASEAAEDFRSLIQPVAREEVVAFDPIAGFWRSPLPVTAAEAPAS